MDDSNLTPIENKSNHGAFRLLLASAFSSIFVFGVVMAVLGAILPVLFESMSLQKGSAANLFLSMNLAMLLMSVIFGPVVDRFGYRFFLLFSALLVSASLFSFSFIQGYAVLVFSVFWLGFGGGGLNGATNALVSDVSPERRGAALNLLGIFFGFGAITVPFLIGTLLKSLGFQKVVFLVCLMTLVPPVLFLAARFPEPKQKKGFPLKEVAALVKSRLLWLIAFMLFFQSANEFSIGGWVSTYLREKAGLAQSGAALLLAGFWLAIIIGRLISARFIKRTGNKALINAGAALALASLVLLSISGEPWLAGLAVVLTGLGFASIYPTALAIAGDEFAKVSGTAFSLIFTVALTGGIISPWLLGKVAQASGLGKAFIIPIINCFMVFILSLCLPGGRQPRISA